MIDDTRNELFGLQLGEIDPFALRQWIVLMHKQVQRKGFYRRERYSIAMAIGGDGQQAEMRRVLLHIGVAVRIEKPQLL